MSADPKTIGYFGFPRRAILLEARKGCGPGCGIIDLDVGTGAPDSGLLPATTCRIIVNIVDNAIAMKNDLAVIVAAVGEGKCDRGRHAARILGELGFDVVESRFPSSEYEDRRLVYSTGRMPLGEKIDEIMATVVDPAPPAAAPEPCEPAVGFWGVPPHDQRILDLFPPETHVYGWTRCVEAGRPGDIDLECFVDKGIPTVFFTQSFCAKQDLAHYLAEMHGGMAIDCHRDINDSIMAKIEAFIRLS